MAQRRPAPPTLSARANYPFLPETLATWYCDECGAWYTSDEIKTSDCDGFATTGSCDDRNVTTEESDAGGLCDDCTRARDG
ncbi:hypothetical protein GGS24DRAFT_497477 [Hypoxylon argillaceum]|nr:hypothetical protein GGS24DRAFT_497477 [Hypoxylon argillaceum]